VAAFCTCCGAEITRKPQACPNCGAPRHGMFPPEGQILQKSGEDHPSAGIDGAYVTVQPDTPTGD
jgi:hypothetical protein